MSQVSNAKPKIADYPFTTLHPNLGVVRSDDTDSFVIADIPGWWRALVRRWARHTVFEAPQSHLFVVACA